MNLEWRSNVAKIGLFTLLFFGLLLLLVGCETESTPTSTPVPKSTPTQQLESIPTFRPTLRPRCDPAYPSVCIPPPPPDLDCGEISYKNFRVLSPDPHRFDRDRDGIGCES